MAAPSYKAGKRQMDTDQKAKHQPGGMMVTWGGGVVGQTKEMDGQREREFSVVSRTT